MSSGVLVQRITDFIVQPLIELLFVAATVVFMWGIFQFIAGGDSEDSRSEGKRHMLWGLIGMFIMVAAGKCRLRAAARSIRRRASARRAGSARLAPR